MILVLLISVTLNYLKKNGLNYFTTKYYKCRGNRIYSSNNSLLDKDTKPYDDIESVFYIFIYFSMSNLPWKRKKNGQHLEQEEIVEIRKN
jgi:hypothetical protein